MRSIDAMRLKTNLDDLSIDLCRCNIEHEGVEAVRRSSTFKAARVAARIDVHHLGDVLFREQAVRRRSMDGPLFEIDRPIEGHIGRGDLCVVGLGRRILDGDLGSHDDDGQRSACLPRLLKPFLPALRPSH